MTGIAANRFFDRARRRLYEILELSPAGDLASTLVDAGLILLIIANAVAVALETVAALDQVYGAWFRLFERVSVAIFTVEYAARLWVCVEQKMASRRHPLTSRLRYAVTPLALIDLVAILPALLGMLSSLDLLYLRLFRLLRLFKLVRYSTALSSLLRVLESEFRTLMAALVVMIGVIFIAAALIYHAERAAQPESFSSIPAAMWWAVVTLTTIGYGDMVPVTGPGRMIASVVMIFGLAVYAIPIGVIASGFAEEIHRHAFVIRMEMVARIPLFGGQSAQALSRISRLLRAEKLPARHVISAAGTRARGLYIIADGVADAHLADRVTSLGAGDFYGERALLQPEEHEVTVVARTPCRLLVLEVADFARLLENEPEIVKAMAPIVTDRLHAMTEAGEITAEAAERSIKRWRSLAGLA